jgi:hypothetical protein
VVSGQIKLVQGAKFIFAKFVVSGQIKLVQGAKFIFAKEVAIGITTDRNFYEDNGIHYC